MKCLSYIQGAAAVRICAAKRLRWIGLGGQVLRGSRRGKWRVALNENQVERAKGENNRHT